MTTKKRSDKKTPFGKLAALCCVAALSLVMLAGFRAAENPTVSSLAEDLSDDLDIRMVSRTDPDDYCMKEQLRSFLKETDRLSRGERKTLRQALAKRYKTVVLEPTAHVQTVHEERYILKYYADVEGTSARARMLREGDTFMSRYTSPCHGMACARTPTATKRLTDSRIDITGGRAMTQVTRSQDALILKTQSGSYSLSRREYGTDNLGYFNRVDAWAHPEFFTGSTEYAIWLNAYEEKPADELCGRMLRLGALIDSR